MICSWCVVSGAWANTYRYFDLELTSEWVELLAEQVDEVGNGQVNLINNQRNTLLSIISVKLSQNINKQQLDIASKILVNMMQRKIGLQVSAQGLDKNNDYYIVHGVINKLPCTIRIRACNQVAFIEISAGDDLKAGLTLGEKITPIVRN